MTLSASYQTTLRTSISEARSLETATGAYATTASAAFNSATNVYASAAAVSGSTTIDLAGSLLNAIGDSFVLSKVDFVRIKNPSTSSALRVLGGATDIPILSSAACFLNLAPSHTFDYLTTTGGLAVTGGSSDTITIEGNGRFELVVIGRA